MSRVDAIRKQLAGLKTLVVAWQTFDLVKALDALNTALTSAELLLEEVADLRAKVDRLEADRATDEVVS